MKNDFDWLKKEISAFRSDFKSYTENQEKKDEVFKKSISELLEKKANRWVEDVMVWAGRIVITSVILALLGLVIVQ